AQTALLMYQRISNLQALTGDPNLERARVELLAELRDVLARAESYVANESGEAALLAETTALLELYLQQRAALESRQAALEEYLQQTQSSLDRIVEALDTLHDNQDQLLRAQSDAMRWNRHVGAWSSAAALVLICGLLVMAWGLHRAVLKPIVALHKTIAAFRSGETDRRA